MDANQRGEANNPTKNGGNEKGKPGAQGKTQGEGALDHSYPKGAEAAPRITGAAHAESSMQSGAGPGVYDSRYQRSDGKGEDLQGGSMQPLGDRPKDQGVSLHGNQQSGSTQATERMNPQNAAQPALQGGSLGSGSRQSSTQGGGQRGPQSPLPRKQGGSMGQQSATTQGTQGGGQPGPQTDTGSVQGGGSMNRQSGSEQGRQGGQDGTQPDQRCGSGRGHDSTDRIGSQTGNYQREMGVHQSNDLQGGLPRSPGNAGPYPEARSTHQTGPDNHADLLRNDRGVHESNNSSGGLPRSPGGANQLSADEKMDDDTGFSNPRRR